MTDSPPLNDLELAEQRVRTFLSTYTVGEIIVESLRGLYDDYLLLADLHNLLVELDRLRSKLTTVQALHAGEHKWWISKRDHVRTIATEAVEMVEDNSNWSEGGPGFVADEALIKLLEQITKFGAARG